MPSMYILCWLTNHMCIIINIADTFLRSLEYLRYSVLTVYYYPTLSYLYINNSNNTYIKYILLINIVIRYPLRSHEYKLYT